MRIGIFVPHAIGDICCSTSLLKYKNILWDKPHITWMINPALRDIVSNNPLIDEVRVGYSDKIRTSTVGKIKKSKNYDFDEAYFLAPWQNRNIIASNIPYAFIPKTILESKLGAIRGPWRPCLYFTPKETQKASTFVGNLPYPKTIMIETDAKSGQSAWDDNHTRVAMKICRETIGSCNFVFASPGMYDKFKEVGVVECRGFTVRQCIPVYNLCNLFIGISSAISCATTAWSANATVPRIDLCHSRNMSSGLMATGKVTMISNISQLPRAISSALR